ncbi:flavoprotein [Bacillus atrophaeus]|uniref:flavoprotein n=1 Tax=Bacillus atrophaeus TaxID=1452 RepID=UPI00123B1FE8|nr:phosphopantothenate--cysteine ligase family flavoprotein [Bacillus atrophaeus]KAA6450009.1 Mersacidin decarboxylase [Bacillus atrophaeus]
MNVSELHDKNLLVGMSGSIASVGISSYLLYFRQHFKEIRVIMTRTAEELIPANTVSYFCDKVYSEYGDSGERQSHVDIGRWADVYCVLPATANVLGQTANGVAMNLLTTTVLAHQHSTIFFPNMNDLMWNKTVVSRNIELLRKDGHIVVDPVDILAFEVASGTRKTNRALITPDKALLEIAKSFKIRGEQPKMR